MTSVVLYAKSPWEPSFRREHFLARQAAANGVDCTFIEAPGDVRALRSLGPARFLRRLAGALAPADMAGLRLVRRTTLAPGHRAAATAAIDVIGLRRTVRRLTPPDAHAVCQLPWQWAATEPRAGARRVFDCTDDWTALLGPQRRETVRAGLRVVEDEADEIVVVAPGLAELFPRRTVTVIPNGVAAASIIDRPALRMGSNRMLYLGTLSERFDAPLMTAVLDALPAWHLDLVGPCHYRGHGDQPSPELEALLDRHPSHCRFHGPVARAAADALIDKADVCVIPNRAEKSKGQSSMKLYDFLARGRAIVMTPGVAPDGPPPGTRTAGPVDEWVDAVTAAATEPDEAATVRLEWVRSQTWDARWPAWSAAVTGTPVSPVNSVGAA